MARQAKGGARARKRSKSTGDRASSRALRSDSVEAIVAAAQEAMQPDLQPPAHIALTPADRPFWVDVIRSRTADEWNDHDLALAANLARTLRQLEHEQGELDSEGTVITNMMGNLVANPRAAIVKDLNARSISLVRVLQIQPAISGLAQDKRKKRGLVKAARQARAEVDEEDSLLA